MTQGLLQYVHSPFFSSHHLKQRYVDMYSKCMLVKWAKVCIVDCILECIVYVQVEMYSMSVVWVYRKCTSCTGVCKYKCVHGACKL